MNAGILSLTNGHLLSGQNYFSEGVSLLEGRLLYCESRWVFNKDLKMLTEDAALISNGQISPQARCSNRKDAVTPKSIGNWDERFQCM